MVEIKIREYLKFGRGSVEKRLNFNSLEEFFSFLNKEDWQNIDIYVVRGGKIYRVETDKNRSKIYEAEDDEHFWFRVRPHNSQVNCVFDILRIDVDGLCFLYTPFEQNEFKITNSFIDKILLPLMDRYKKQNIKFAD